MARQWLAAPCRSSKSYFLTSISCAQETEAIVANQQCSKRVQSIVDHFKAVDIR